MSSKTIIPTLAAVAIIAALMPLYLSIPMIAGSVWMFWPEIKAWWRDP